MNSDAVTLIRPGALTDLAPYAYAAVAATQRVRTTRRRPRPVSRTAQPTPADRPTTGLHNPLSPLPTFGTKLPSLSRRMRPAAHLTDAIGDGAAAHPYRSKKGF